MGYLAIVTIKICGFSKIVLLCFICTISSMKNNKIVKDHYSGFSLVEVIVAMALMTVIGLSMMSLFSTMFKTQRGINARDAMRDLTVEVRSVLSDKTACLNTFTGQSLLSGSAAVTVVKDPLNAVKFTAGNAYMGGLLSFSSVVMQDFVPNSSPPNTGKAKLYIYADKTGEFIGVKTTHAVLSAQVEIDASKNITKCIAIGGLNDSLWQVSTTNTSDIFFQGGNVGVGTNNPQAALEVNGPIKLGSAIKGDPCATEGTMAYDYTNHTALVCDNLSAWKSVGNDGSGSLSQNGYWKLPSGLMIQWGRDTVQGDMSSHNFVTPFPNSCLMVVVTSWNRGSHGANGHNHVLNCSSTGFVGTVELGPGVGAGWIAIGF